MDGRTYGGHTARLDFVGKVRGRGIGESETGIGIENLLFYENFAGTYMAKWVGVNYKRKTSTLDTFDMYACMIFK